METNFIEEKLPIATVGLGLMGSSIATCILAAGHPVTALIKDLAKKSEATSRIRGFLQQLSAEGILNGEPEVFLDTLKITDNIRDLGQHTLVIESIVENSSEKKKLFAALEAVISPAAIIGSNTSAIPVTLLQQGMKHPERLLGIHWAEPAHITRFMEIICGEQSDIACAHRVMALATHWGKEPSLVKKDIRGFITNRIMYAMLREAFYLVENGYATVEDVDRSVRNDLGYWITFAGPFRFMDITGIPAYLSVMKELFGELDNSATVPPAIEALVASGAKGISNAKGFYPYTTASAAQWEQKFIDFSYDIRKLAAKYTPNQDE